MPLKRCLLCGSEQVITTNLRGATILACRACLAMMRVELAPPDQPDVAGLIEVLVEPIVNRPSH
jgi:hypothetical protein